MPDNKAINTMWQANADGAGLAYWRPGEQAITINKGFMKLKALRMALGELDLGSEDLMVLHFRWATHGLSDAGNCHPFPLSREIEALRAVSGQFPCAVAHNGIFGSMPCHATLSDTQKFIAKILADEAIIDNISNPAVRALIAGYCGSTSKLAIIKPDAIELIGDFEEDKLTGLLYSNGGYKTWASRCTAYNAHGWSNLRDREEIEPNLTHDKCEYCDDVTNIEYVEEVQLFLCNRCLGYVMEGKLTIAED